MGDDEVTGTECVAVEFVRYRDRYNGRPTCLRSYPSGEMCRALTLGVLSARCNLAADGNGAIIVDGRGLLIPRADCPVWADDQDQ